MNLCLSFAAHIQLLQPECEMANYSLPNEPRHAVASWLKHTIKLSKLFSDGHGRLINLNTAEQIAHSCNPQITSGSA